MILAAGKGTRMKSDLPKVAHEVLYKPMICHIVDELKKMDMDEIIVVVGYQAEAVKAVLDDKVTFIYQHEQLGTGHAVMQAADLLKDKEGITLVLNGDAPLIRHETLEALMAYHEQGHYQGTIVTAHCPLSQPFGRIVRQGDRVEKIVEFKDASEEIRQISEMNAGEYCFDNKALFEALSCITNDNAQHEYYLTDVVGVMNDHGQSVGGYVIEDFNEVGGINDRVALSEATAILKQRINRQHLLNGVNIIDMNNTYIGSDVEIGEGTTIEPGCILKGKTVIGKHCYIGGYCELTNTIVKDNVEIKFSVISDSVIESGTDIGPYARLRNQCHILENVHIGNFVEMKKATFGKGSKSAHLTYIGDATVGEGVNIGCGTITVNYDGKNKSQTTIKDHAFIGCNTNLVAPVTVEENAFVAAGSTIVDTVPENAMGIARARQVNKEGYAKVLEKKRNKK